MGMISSSNRNELSGQGKGRRWRAKPLPPASSVSITAGPTSPQPRVANALGINPRDLLHPWCISRDERERCAAAYSGPAEQRYLADSGNAQVQRAVLEATTDFEALSTLTSSGSRWIRVGVADRVAGLGLIDGGSAEDVLGLMADDEDSLVRGAVARATSDPELKRYLARDTDHNVRRSVLTHTEDQGLIALLANDPHPFVRVKVAKATNDQALLAAYLVDEDEWVRSTTRRRLGRT